MHVKKNPVLMEATLKLPLAILRTLMTLIMVGLIGIMSDFSSSRTIPTTDKKTMATSS